MSLDKALREILQMNEQIKTIEKLKSAPAPTAHAAERRKQDVLEKVEELMPRINKIHLIDPNERVMVKSLQDRLLADLEKLRQCEPETADSSG